MAFRLRNTLMTAINAFDGCLNLLLMVPFHVENKLMNNLIWLNTSFEKIVLNITQPELVYTLCLYNKIVLQNLNLTFNKHS